MQARNLSILVSLVAATSLGLTSCGSASDATGSGEASVAPAASSWQAPEGLSGEVQFYSANPQAISNDLAEAFKKKTGVDVKIFAGATGKVTARLKAEEDNPQADVVYVASWSAASALAKSGAYEALKLSDQAQIPTKWVGDDKQFAGRDASALTLVVNTDKVKDAPKDWEDLTKPEFKDQVIMPDPRESGTAADLVSAMVTKWGKDKTWELFDKLFANGMVVRGANGPALDAVQSGSKSVVFGGVDYSAYGAIRKGEPLEAVLPSSGTTVTPRPLLLMKSSKNKDAAKAFIDFMFSEEGQTISAKHDLIPASSSVKRPEGPALDEITLLNDDLNAITAGSKDIKAEFADRYLKG